MRKIFQFLKEVRHEFYNITWPKREALIQLTVVVISISIIISLILGGFDYLFTNSFAALGNLKSQPTTNAPLVVPTIGLPASPSADLVTPAITNSVKKPISTPKK